MVGRRERKVVRIKGWWAEGGKGGEKGWWEEESGRKDGWEGGEKGMVERREEKVARKDAWWAEGGESGVKDGGKKRG